MRQARLGFIFVLSSLLWFTFLSCFLPGDCRGVVAGVPHVGALSVLNVLVLVALVLGEIQSRVDSPSQRHVVELLLAARRERVVRLLIPLSIGAATGALWWILFRPTAIP